MFPLLQGSVVNSVTLASYAEDGSLPEESTISGVQLQRLSTKDHAAFRANFQRRMTT